MDNNIVSTISIKRKDILVHSYIYYKLNDTIISDEEFDKRCNNLVLLQEQYPTEASEAKWSEDFFGWNGSTGYDLPFIHVADIATATLNYVNKLKGV